MKSIKIKLRKRSKSGNEYESYFPSKRRKEKTEKENNKVDSESFGSPRLKSGKSDKVLNESPIPSIRRNANKLVVLSDTSEEDSENEELDEMLMQLKKSGIKTVNYEYKQSKPIKSNSTYKVLVKSVENKSVISSRNNSLRKNLVREFEELQDTVKNENKVIRNCKLGKAIVKLERLPEDCILKTPKQTRRTEITSIPYQDKRLNSDNVPLRRSNRRLSMPKEEIGKESMYFKTSPTSRQLSAMNNSNCAESVTLRKYCSLKETELAETPKKSALRKKEISTPRTPICKTEEKLPTTPLEKAWLKLHGAAVPDYLPCREKEYNNILTFVTNKLWDGIGGCMYISGVPGTGKTATVTQVIKHLKKCAENEEVPDFTFIEINGMRLADPSLAYVHIWQKIFGRNEKISAIQAQKYLDDWFNKNNKKKENKTTILLVDELDLICTKKQDVVYNLLDWPTRTHSRLVVLTIANTMDMPERFFKGRITSRMGLTRLTFTPYTYKQLQEIVMQRLKGLDVFVPDALQLVTRKVAAVSGDARRALDICRRSTEMPGPDDTVNISHIEKAIKEMTNSNIVKVLRSCGKIEKLFLQSLCDVSFRSNVDEVDLLNVVDQLFSTCILEGIARPSISSILAMTHRLKCSRLIFTSQWKTGILQRVMLNVTQDDIHYAFQT